MGRQTEETREPEIQPVWAVAANVVLERKFGPGGEETRRGTKQFAPGAKVYFLYGFGGWERIAVVGRHRGSLHYVELYMSSTHLTNWRAELVYSSHLVRLLREASEMRLKGPLDDAAAKERAERYAETLQSISGAPLQPNSMRLPPTETG
jgi:hypothetical protein